MAKLFVRAKHRLSYLADDVLGCRIRVTLEGSAPLPVFHGDLPVDAPRPA